MPRRPALIGPAAVGGVSVAVTRSATMAARSSSGRGTSRGYGTGGEERPRSVRSELTLKGGTPASLPPSIGIVAPVM